jgi:hypothetical protein
LPIPLGSISACQGLRVTPGLWVIPQTLPQNPQPC